MNICLIYPTYPPFGLIVIGTILKENGHHVIITDGNHVIPNADVYGIYTITPYYSIVLKILKSLESKIVIAGGPHATAVPHLVIKDGFDIVVVGECEGNIDDIVSIAYKGYKGIIHGISIDNLDGLPYWDYSLIDQQLFTRIIDGYNSFPYMTGRGCSCNCIFCWTVCNNIRLRFHSIERIIMELDKNNARVINFTDDNIVANKKRFTYLTSALKEWGAIYSCMPRVADLTAEMCKQLEDSGCQFINVEVESGANRILKKMRTGHSTSDIKRGIENAKKAGLKIGVRLVIGFPGETWKTIQETVKFLKLLPFDEFNSNIFTPFPGTLAYHHCDKFNITHLSTEWSDYSKVAFETKHLKPDMIYSMHDYVINELLAAGKTLCKLL